MKKLVLFIAVLAVSSFSYLTAQERVIEDFETIAMNLFSGGTNGALDVIANPDPVLNGSMYVGKMVRGFDGDPWAGWYADLNMPFDASVNKYIHLWVWKPRISPVDFKLENPATGANSGDVYPMNAQSLTDQWEELVFDMSAVPDEYTRIVLIPDFEDPLTLTEDITLYFDNIYANDDPTVGSAPVIVFEDFEHIPLNLMLGGDEDNSTMTRIVNPDMSGINTSHKVIEFLRDMDGVPWGGFWSALDTPVDITTNKYAHVKVWKPRISPLKFKIEKPNENHEIFSMNEQTVTNGWEDIVFDFSEWTGEWPTVVFMPDFIDPVGLTEDITIYFDDIIFSDDPNPMTLTNVTFNVDMNEAEDFDPATQSVYIAGSFLGWAQPGSNTDFMLEETEPGSMIYTKTFALEEIGEIQYKYFLVESAPTWDFGEWTGDPNRVVIVTGETTYDDVWADKPVWVTFNVDMTDADPFDPETDDVYIAGDLANGWAQPGTITNYMMSPTEDNDMIYTITLVLYEGDYAYKYFRVINDTASWDNGEWTGDPNRTFTADTTKTINNIWGVVGINEHPAVTFNLYPNPASNMLTIDKLENAEMIEIYNMAGMKVRTVNQINNESINIDVAELNTGMYMIVVHQNGEVQATKFLKN
ncbi:MAG: T9SS type A sorting domain-containing protein [Bacteroidales bacterium]|nr:T9SS type A sorting domain-containing protein [Bacteroidales bacterium]